MKKFFLLSFWINFSISQISFGALLYVEKGNFLALELPSLVGQIKDIPRFLNLPGEEKNYPTISVKLPNGSIVKATLLHHTVVFWGPYSEKEEKLEREKKITLTFKKKEKENLFFEYFGYTERKGHSLSEEFSEVREIRRTVLIKLEHPKT